MEKEIRVSHLNIAVSINILFKNHYDVFSFGYETYQNGHKGMFPDYIFNKTFFPMEQYNLTLAYNYLDKYRI